MDIGSSNGEDGGKDRGRGNREKNRENYNRIVSNVLHALDNHLKIH